MFLNYASITVCRAINMANEAKIPSQISQAIETIHRLGFLQCKPMPETYWYGVHGWLWTLEASRSKWRVWEYSPAALPGTSSTNEKRFEERATYFIEDIADVRDTACSQEV